MSESKSIPTHTKINNCVLPSHNIFAIYLTEEKDKDCKRCNIYITGDKDIIDYSTTATLYFEHSNFDKVVAESIKSLINRDNDEICHFGGLIILFYNIDNVCYNSINKSFLINTFTNIKGTRIEKKFMVSEISYSKTHKNQKPDDILEWFKNKINSNNE
jgi:hypothetical protein